LYAYDVDPSVYDMLIECAHEGIADYQRYYRAHARGLGLDEQYPFDMATYVSDFNPGKVDYDDAVAEVTDALSILGEDYIDTFKGILSSGHVDVYPNDTKTTGAFETQPLSGEQLEQVENIISDILEGEARHHRKAKGRQRMRFISAISCRGKYSLEESVKKLCKQYYLFENPLHAHQLLSIVAKQARDYGLETILCPEALRPERLEAVLLPESEICFRAAEADSCGTGMRICFGKEPEKGERNLHANLIKEKLREQTTMLLAKAKSLHDELEAIYRPYMDFAALNRYTDEYIERLFK
jgi:hypothetical protein